MLIAIIILSVLLIAAIGTSLYYRYKYYQYMHQLIDDYHNEPHSCNYCKISYLFTREDRKQTVCDKCGRTLTLHETNPNYAPPNDGEPFEEFDFDTWLENQPEGTFVQGGGIDKETFPNNDKKD